MSFESRAAQDQVYQTYRFGRARQLYRGPQPDLDAPYIACIGGSETFGKFVDRPYADCLSARLGMTVANFGTPGAGPTFFLRDPVLLETLSRATLCVVQIGAGWANSNRLYAVRKRRNERLSGVSEMLKLMYPELELDKFRYVQKMLGKMYSVDATRFRMVEHEIRAAWVARMSELLDQIETRKALFWFSERAPEEERADLPPEQRLAPAFIDAGMLGALEGRADARIDCVVPPEEGNLLRLDQPVMTEGLIVSRSHPSPRMHEIGAERLDAALGPLLR